MKDFLLLHSDVLFAIIGLCVLLGTLWSFDIWKDTKCDTIAFFIFGLSSLYGSVTIAQEIGRWFLK